MNYFLLGLIQFFVATSWAQQADPLVQNCITSSQREAQVKFKNAGIGKYQRCEGIDDTQLEIQNRQIALALEGASECFDLDWREMFPKFKSESGFIPNILGVSGDRGVGQLTTPAIEDVQKNFQKIYNRMKLNANPQCQLLVSKVENWGVKSFFQFPKSEACQVMGNEIGLYRNIVFSFALTYLNQEYVKKAYLQEGIPSLLIQSGYQDAPHTQIQKILVMIGYNNGGLSSVKDLKNYLTSRIDFIQRKKLELWKIEGRKDLVPDFLAYVSAKDFNFSKGTENYLNLIQSLPKTTSTSEKELLLRNISVSLMGFPEWLKIWQSHGGPGYLSGVFQVGKVFSRTHPECVNLDIFDLN